MDIDVILANGEKKHHKLSNERVTLGRSADADISLPEAAELEPLHLLFMPRSDGCWVSSAKDCLTPAMIDGKIFDNGLLQVGTEIDIGSVTVAFTKELKAEVDKASRARKMFIVLAAVGVLGWQAYSKTSRNTGLPLLTDEPPPSLFGVSTAPCPDSQFGPQEEGLRLSEIANAKMERYHYDVQDGIQAVVILDVAITCFSKSNDAVLRDRLKNVRANFSANLEDEYARMRLGLEQALKTKNVNEALNNAISLNELLAHTDPENLYMKWLNKAYRKLTIKKEKDEKLKDEKK